MMVAKFGAFSIIHVENDKSWVSVFSLGSDHKSSGFPSLAVYASSDTDSEKAWNLSVRIHFPLIWETPTLLFW